MNDSTRIDVSARRIGDVVALLAEPSEVASSHGLAREFDTSLVATRKTARLRDLVKSSRMYPLAQRFLARIRRG